MSVKKYIKKVVIAGILISSISIPAYASWHWSDITLPRRGAWSTVTREASGGTQKTQVTKNAYAVNSRIIGDNGVGLSGWRKHKPGTGTIRTYKTGVHAGEDIKAQFKTSVINYRTTTARLAWEP